MNYAMLSHQFISHDFRHDFSERQIFPAWLQQLLNGPRHAAKNGEFTELGMEHGSFIEAKHGELPTKHCDLILLWFRTQDLDLTSICFLSMYIYIQEWRLNQEK